MSMPERSFQEVFDERPEPSNEVSANSIKTTLFGAAILLRENPSEEALADTIGFLSSKPKNYIDQAYSEFGWAFEEDGPSRTENPMSLIGKVISRIHSAYDWETDELRPDFDPQIEAEDITDGFLLDRENNKWRERLEQLTGEKDRARKTQLARSIKQDAIDYISSHPVAFRGREGRKIIPTWENISWGGNAELKLGHSEGVMPAFDDARKSARRVIERDNLENILEQLPRVDKEQFDGLRKTFGAKAANLLILQNLAQQIDTLLGGDETHESKIPNLREINIPDFLPVPVDLYKKWEAGEDIDEDLIPYFQWTQGLVIDGGGYYVDEQDAYMVRSSAVYSEDGEELSGAGIYESVEIEQEDANSFEAFKSAIVSVYSSTNSERAISYREENNIPTEEMGLVIQRKVPEKYADRFDRTHIVTVNSSTPGVHGLTEVLEDDKRFFVRKDIVDDNLAVDIPEGAAHFRPDGSGSLNTIYEHELVRLSVLSSLLERVWDGPIQLEMVGENIVQVRRVSDKFSGEVVEFPDEQELIKGSGIGIGDKTLKVLNSRTDNSESEGVVQFQRNWEWSFRGDPAYLPKVGGVIVQEATRDGNGHLQTLCVEKGLLCLYPNEESDEFRIPELKKGATVRIVSNGIEARLYKVGDEDPVVQEREYYSEDDDL